jgi:hypothetical protein
MLIVGSIIVGVLEIDTLVVRSYANRVEGCRISLLDERTMHLSRVAFWKIRASLIVVVAAGLNRCRCGRVLLRSIKINVNINGSVFPNFATIMELTD